MSSTEPTLPPTNPRRRMLWLVVGHVVVGLIGALAAYFAGTGYGSTRRAAFVGIVFSQTSLLGIWGSLGASPWWKRLVGVVVGVGYLGLLLGFSFHELDRIIFLWVVAATTISALPLLLVRLFRVAMRLDSSAGSVERFQFSIRHLLTLTFVVACLISMRNCVEPYAIEVIETPDGVVSDYFDEAVYDWLFPATVVGVLGILPVWFVLATKQLVLSCIGLLAAGVCAGYWLGRFHDDPPSLWMLATITEVVAVVVSLLVVRSCGYRLVRLPARRVSVDPDRQNRSGSEEKSA